MYKNINLIFKNTYLGGIIMTLKRMENSEGILKAMLIHEYGNVSYREFTSYEAIVAYRERNKKDKLILEEGTIV